MKSWSYACLALCLLCLPTTFSRAEEATPPAAPAPEDLAKQLIGYWIIDLESDVTKSFLTAIEADEVTRDEMTHTTFEFRAGEMRLHIEDEPVEVQKVTIKTQDPATRTLTADFHTPGDDEPTAMILNLNGDRLSLFNDANEEEVGVLGMKRITAEEFEKRTRPKPADPAPDAPKEDAQTHNDFPTAKPVPGKPGFVYSPYDNQIVDLREVPSGTLVVDPSSLPEQKKYFRAP